MRDTSAWGEELTYEPMFEGEEVDGSLLDAEDEGVPSGRLVQREVLLYPSPNSSFLATSAHFSAGDVTTGRKGTRGQVSDVLGKTKQDRTETWHG